MNSEMEKETYEEPKTEIIVFENEDVIIASGGGAVSTPKDEFDW